MANDCTVTPIILWCHPRSCSTAFERAFLQREDTHTFHEPLGDPFYFGKHRACRRYADEVCAQSEAYTKTPQAVAQALLTCAQEHRKTPCRYIFVKYVFAQETLHHLHPDARVFPDPGRPAALRAKQNPTVLPTALLQRFQHTFLIRTPQKSIPSYYKCTQENAAGFDFFDAGEAGYQELKLLYDWIADPTSTFHQPAKAEPAYAHIPAQRQVMPPPLIDAHTLLENPGVAVHQFCDAVQVPFTETMLSWSPGEVDIWAKWGGYHATAEHSSGFHHEQPPEDAAPPQPPEVQNCIEYVRT